MEAALDARIRPLPSNDYKVIRSGGSCVLYIMARDQRVQDNHALLAAQAAALQARLPLVVAFRLLPRAGDRAREHYVYMLQGLRQVAYQLQALQIPMIMVRGDGLPSMLKACGALRPVAVYFDFSPLTGPRHFQEQLAAQLAAPCYVVDTHNIVPCWLASDKQAFGAYTFRPKIVRQLVRFLVAPEPVVRHPFVLGTLPLPLLPAPDVMRTLATGLTANHTAVVVESGEQAALQRLEYLVGEGLGGYAATRNDPSRAGQSGLSPYVHFGQLSALRIALEVVARMQEPPLLFHTAQLPTAAAEPTWDDSANALLEELIVRKELSDNFCYYNSQYRSLNGAPQWAKASLAQHEADPREFVYSRAQWQTADTHDPAWNAAQQQLRQTGTMHGYMRMYWAKKLLEWSASPPEALDTACYLNDFYSLDGGDPNGYAGILWSIAGLHDRAWAERPVYGKIRYMNRAGLARKFDLAAYEQRWAGSMRP